jgi:hypothetical protein
MILTPHVVDSRDETDLLTEEFQHKILGALKEKDIRSLYGIEDEPQDKPEHLEQKETEASDKESE